MVKQGHMEKGAIETFKPDDRIYKRLFSTFKIFFRINYEENKQWSQPLSWMI